mmetsp:Transcript_23235/g.54806  ORF Transcript_23235/g.54806 Transcript_23235/m.54806 type:complete len:496 (-) Transcript_23235:53-1540(-)
MPRRPKAQKAGIGNPCDQIGDMSSMASMWAASMADALQPPSDIHADTFAAVQADIFGQMLSMPGPPTNMNLNQALADFEKEIDGIPPEAKSALVQARRLDPDIDGELVLQFLWATNFNVEVAAKKLANYWEQRYRLFGPEKFFLPLTLKGALSEDSLALSRGYVQLLPCNDSAGRAVIFMDWSCHEPGIGYDQSSMVRVFWYIIHCAMQDTSCLQNGIIMLMYPQEARLDQFDHALWNEVSKCLALDLPVRWRSTHIVHPNRFFSIIHPVFMSSLPQNVQDRVVVHQGTKMKVLANLLRYALPWDKIPQEIGGCIQLDFEKWLAGRVEIENDSSTGSKPVYEVVSSALGQGFSHMSQASKAGNFGGFGVKVPMLTSSGQRFTQFDEGTTASASNFQDKKPTAKALPAKKPIVVKSGRKSDPRMDGAVQAKLNDPTISLLDALKIGGFQFPGLDDSSSTPLYTVVDADNVKITQRKNQLLRRIRMAKKKQQSGNDT